MTGVVSPISSRAVQIIIGVDTHKDQHVAVAIDQQGVRIGEHPLPVTTCGYKELERWSRSLGEIRTFGIEGTGSYGVRIGEHPLPVTTCGYKELERWSRSLGEIRTFGIEGTGSYGAGLARFLTCRGYTVIEVNRPDRSVRYRKGKSDPTDAEMAARAVLAGVADATPKSGKGEVEMIRMLKSAKNSA